MNDIYEKIEFTDTINDETVCFYVIEQTVLNEKTYLLVSDLPPEEDGASGFIFEAADINGEEITYVPVEDDQTLDILAGIFDELLEDTDII